MQSIKVFVPVCSPPNDPLAPPECDDVEDLQEVALEQNTDVRHLLMCSEDPRFHDAVRKSRSNKVHHREDLQRVLAK